MGTFVATYLIVWTAIALYVARLGTKQNKLKERLDHLREQVVRRQETDGGKVRAA